MNLNKHLYYWIAPTILLISCVLVYYFNFLNLGFIISPEYNREFGLIENIQLITIIATIWVAFKSFIKREIKLIKYFFLGVSLFSIFIFLEEMDYGLHFIEYFSGIAHQKSTAHTEIRNIHNQGNLLPYITKFVYISFALVIIVIPLIASRIKNLNKYIKWLIPSTNLAYSLVAMFILSQFTLFVEGNVTYELTSLENNLSEFEEVFIYYIAFLYIFELSKKQLSK